MLNVSPTNPSFHFLLLIQFKVAGGGGGGGGRGVGGVRLAAAITNTFKLNSITVMPSPLTLLHKLQPAEPSNESYTRKTGGTRQKTGAFLGLWALNAC